MYPLSFTPADAPRLPTLLADAPDGARVTLAEGDYLLPETIVLRANISLRGVAGRTRLLGRGIPLVTMGARATEARFSGLTFEGGAAACGGAIQPRQHSALVIDQCRFVRNRASKTGGALSLAGVASAKITRSLFEGNEADEGGGAMTVGDGGEVLVEGCVFFRNRAKVGGGVYLGAAGAIKLVHCTFVDNVATWPKGGGAFFVLAGKTIPATAIVANCIFRGKEAINADGSKDCRVFFVSSFVAPETFAQPRLENRHGNTLGVPQLVPLSGGLFALAPGAPGVGTADPIFTSPTAIDLLGRPFVQNGRADPGALAGVPR